MSGLETFALRLFLEKKCQAVSIRLHSLSIYSHCSLRETTVLFLSCEMITKHARSILFKVYVGPQIKRTVDAFDV